MRTLLIAIGLLLSACASQPALQPHPVVLVPETDKVNIPATLLQKCPLIPQLENRAYTNAELLALMKVWINISEACRTKNSILVNTVREAFNIPPVAPNTKP